MKTRLNILSILLVFLFTFALGHEIYKGAPDFRQGFREGYKARNNNKSFTDFDETDLGFKHQLTLMLNTDNDLPVDSILNKKTGEYLIAEYETIHVFSKKPISSFMNLLLFIGYSIVIISSIILLVSFYKVIMLIKAGSFFDMTTIRKLRRMGISFCVLAITKDTTQYFSSLEIAELVDISGYSIVSGEWFSSSLWIYGLISLLVAESFAFGRKLKEEQDLTI